jgi:hypothetical protein
MASVQAGNLRAKLVPILHSYVVDLRRHATGVEKRFWIYGEPFRAIQNVG